MFSDIEFHCVDDVSFTRPALLGHNDFFTNTALAPNDERRAHLVPTKSMQQFPQVGNAEIMILILWFRCPTNSCLPHDGNFQQGMHIANDGDGKIHHHSWHRHTVLSMDAVLFPGPAVFI
jgi:hypothetical protein